MKVNVCYSKSWLHESCKLLNCFFNGFYKYDTSWQESEISWMFGQYENNVFTTLMKNNRQHWLEVWVFACKNTHKPLEQRNWIFINNLVQNPLEYTQNSSLVILTYKNSLKEIPLWAGLQELKKTLKMSLLFVFQPNISVFNLLLQQVNLFLFY